MTLKIKLTNDFKEELDDICEYLNFMSKSEKLSEKLILNINKKIEILSSSPEICPKINGKYRYNLKYRKMIITHYIIIYLIDYNENTVCIMHIYDGRSNYTRNLI